MIDEFLAANARNAGNATDTGGEGSVGQVARVEQAVRAAVAAEIMPRHRKLTADDIVEKSGPHDLVTRADREAENHLTEALTRILPGSVVVGEEAVHADPAVYGALSGDAPVWIVDPVDGTRQFVRGEAGFCTLVALAHHGELIASWTYAPVLQEMAVAVRGRGATLNGKPLRSGSPEPGAVLRVAMSHPDFTTDEQKRALLGLRTEGIDARACGSAGLEYLAVARGALDALAFNWEFAWDHAAGLLLVAEAGGSHATLSGARFRLAGDNDLPFAVGRDEATVARIREALLTGV
ncbi:inositol monophosphatase family protein [Streptomyces sp. NBC_00102]|uniref:inositol monophosphatase family protein n=1 Tax=Streptomyces sp. NBC_00102 TaxID=2975652 RepID=UPI0022572FAA|nr:inositol monophosphatase family protein [Streptomyces sp. NBC_00102]MCX5400869.1 inositol monophosphatase [Streptomyces sp. NBC_00102]